MLVHQCEINPSARKEVRRLQKQRSRLVALHSLAKAVDRAQKRLEWDSIKQLELAAIQNVPKGELKRARRTAISPHSFPFLSIPSEIFQDNSDDEILTITDGSLRVAEPDIFPGKVVIQDRPEAITQALAEHSKDRLLRKEPGRHSFHVDTAVSRGDDLAGIAVVHKTHRQFWASDWAVKGYRIQADLDQEDVEAWAIWQALEVVLEKVNLDQSLEKPVNPCSLAIIYSDCQRVLQKLRNEWPGGGLVRHHIICQTQKLRRLGVNIELHWVPGHRHVPGNVLADLVAKKALQSAQ